MKEFLFARVTWNLFQGIINLFYICICTQNIIIFKIDSFKIQFHQLQPPCYHRSFQVRFLSQLTNKLAIGAIVAGDN